VHEICKQLVVGWFLYDKQQNYIGEIEEANTDSAATGCFIAGESMMMMIMRAKYCIPATPSRQFIFFVLRHCLCQPILTIFYTIE
jgi:hypothetical protein